MAACLLAVSSVGCDLDSGFLSNVFLRAVALPAPPPEVPACNVPTELHVRNWLGPQRQGSCVHATIKNCMVWCNELQIARDWPYADGEYASRLRQRLDAAGIGYQFTERAEVQYLDWATEQRLPAVIWWKPSHCCMFAGFVDGEDGRKYAAVLDNNYPGKFEYTEKSQFVRLWAGYGGFALIPLKNPSTSIPYKSYELVSR